jgi:hypothetical protein
MQLVDNQLIAFFIWHFSLVQSFLFMARSESCCTFAPSSLLLTIQLIKTKFKMRTKEFIKSLLLLTALVPMMLFTSCATTDDGDYVAPIQLTEKIGGNWVLNTIVQTDETNATELALTSLLGFDTFNLNLSEGGQFSVSGNAPKLLPTSGTWELDNNFVKSTGDAIQLILKGSEGIATLTVTTTPGAKPELGFQLTRKQGGHAFVSYKYSLVSV